MNSKVYKWCAVPLCKNTSIATPNKLFVYVPNKKIVRDKWLKLARRDPAGLVTNSSIYFCEDHFDIPNDMENYMQYHLMGSVSQVRMKPGCIPKKFECQPDRKKRTSDIIERSYIRKKQKMMALEECEKEIQISSSFDCEESGSGMSDMDNLSRCRICMIKDVRMQHIVSEDIQQIYEKLTDVPFTAVDDRPSQVCYMCYARLQSCYKLRVTCLLSENFFTQTLENKAFKLSPLQHDKLQMKRTQITYININQFEGPSDDSSDDDIKHSLVTTEDVQVKEETFEDVPMGRKVQPDEQNWLVAKKVQLDKLKKYSDIKSSKLNTEVRFEASKEIVKKKQISSKQASKNCADERNPYISDICNRGFHHVGDLLKQARVYKDPRPYKCEKCEKCFTAKYRLERHKRVHSGERPYQCDICETRFKFKSNICAHMRIHTGEKRYKCDVCETRFILYYDLIKHIRIHTGEKLIKCNICEKGFACKSNLLQHMLVHTGEKPYTCNICEKKFRQRNHLTNHIRMHTGEKPYQCNFCEKSFSQKGNFNCHLLTHESKKQ